MKKRLIALLLCLTMMAVDVNYAFAEEPETTVETAAEESAAEAEEGSQELPSEEESTEAVVEEDDDESEETSATEETEAVSEQDSEQPSEAQAEESEEDDASLENEEPGTTAPDEEETTEAAVTEAEEPESSEEPESETSAEETREIINSGKCGENVTFTLYDDGELVISGEGEMWEDPFVGFESSVSYKKVIINEGVTSIGSYAFCGCTSLTEITIPISVDSIGVEAFKGCSSLKKVIIVNNDIRFSSSEGESVFEGCGDSLVLYGNAGSNTQIFAETHGIPFEIFCEHTNTVETAAVSPTCVSLGYTAGVFCNDCGYYVSGHKGVDTVPHRDENKDNTCDVCGKVMEAVSSGTCGKDVTWKLYKGGLLVISGKGAIKDIDFGALEEEQQIKEVVIEEEITEIGESVFQYCSYLTKITIPESMTSIGGYAFNNCSSLTEVTIPQGVTEIQYDTFSGCSSLTKITIPESVTSIGGYAFYNCSNLTEVNIPQGVSEIQYGTFKGCSSLAKINIPDGVSSIGNEAFYECTSLTEIILPPSVNYIEDEAFYGCSSLKKVVIINNDIEIEGSNTFKGCSTDLALYGNAGSNIQKYATKKKIPFEVFCLHEHTVETSIVEPTCSSYGNEKGVFCNDCGYYISGHERIEKIPHTDNDRDNICDVCGKTIVVLASGKCGTGVTWTLYEGGTLIISGKGKIKANASESIYSDEVDVSYSKVIIDEGITAIGDEAFAYLSGLTDVVISGSVTSIGNYAFSSCDNLKRVTLQNGIKSIGESAFSYCRSLTGITIPESVTRIGDSAFSSCNMTDITIPESVTSIGSYAFAYCDSLTDITIQNGVSIIGEEAFDCENLTSAIVLCDNAKMDYGVFGYNNNNLTIYGHAGSPIQEYAMNYGLQFDVYCQHNDVVDVPAAASSCTACGFTEGTYCNDCGRYISGHVQIAKLSHADANGDNTCDICGRATAVRASGTCGKNAKWVLYKDGLLEITGTGALYFENDAPWYNQKSYIVTIEIGDGVTNAAGFSDCNNLQMVTMADSVRLICNEAFYGCEGLKTVKLSKWIRTIGDQAFAYCTKLEAIELPETVLAIGYSAFEGCNMLKHVNIENVVILGHGAFFDTGITSIEIPKKISRISNSVFCASGLSTVTIPSNIKEIGEYAFNGSRLKTVTIPENVGLIDAGAFCYCDELTSAVILNKNAMIGENAFTSDEYTPLTLYGYAGSTAETFAKQNGITFKAIPAIATQPKNITTDADKAISFSVFVAGKAPEYQWYYRTDESSAWAPVSETSGTSSTLEVTAAKAMDGYQYYCKVTDLGTTLSSSIATLTIKKPAQSLTVKAAASSITVGNTTNVTTTGAKGKVTYTSSNTSIATVDKTTGKVTAKKAGTVKITATAALTPDYAKTVKTVTIKVLPAATSSLTTANLSNGIKLTWKAVAGATGYKIYRDNKLVRKVSGGNTVTYTDTNKPANGAKVMYKVVAFAATGDSPLSKSVTTYYVTALKFSSLKSSAKKKMTVKWKKNTKATGYEIQYSTTKDFSANNKTVTITKAKTVSKVIKKLTSKTTYYVRVRAYKTVSNVKYYSAWSATKSVKVK